MTGIRPARPGDAPGIAAIMAPIIRDTTITFSPTPLAPEGVDIANTFVATQGAEVIGFAKHGPFRGGAGYAHTAEITLHLAPQARGTGLGKALLEQLEIQARDAGKHSLIAGISAENDNAIGFHAHHGFAEVGRVPQAGHKFGRYIDLVLMQKFL